VEQEEEVTEVPYAAEMPMEASQTAVEVNTLDYANLSSSETKLWSRSSRSNRSAYDADCSTVYPMPVCDVHEVWEVLDVRAQSMNGDAGPNSRDLSIWSVSDLCLVYSMIEWFMMNQDVRRPFCRSCCAEDYCL
jgi:hypothetical protein